MRQIRESRFARVLSLFAAFLYMLVQGGGAAWAAGSTTSIIHKPMPYFVAGKRIRLEATITDPKSVTVVRAYFKGKTQADYVFVPMKEQESVKNSYTAILPALAASNQAIEYLFLVVNGANEISKTEPFVVSKSDSDSAPSWQMVKDDGPMKLFTEAPNAPSSVAAFSDSVSVDVVESGLRFGAVAGLYGAYSSAAGAGAAAGATGSAGSATSAGTATVSSSAGMGGGAIAGIVVGATVLGVGAAAAIANSSKSGSTTTGGCSGNYSASSSAAMNTQYCSTAVLYLDAGCSSCYGYWLANPSGRRFTFDCSGSSSSTYNSINNADLAVINYCSTGK